MPRHHSIRDHLEQAIWRDDPQFAKRHAEQRAPRRPASPALPDRLLFILAACLLLLLIVRVEAARADSVPAPAEDAFWGIEAVTSDGAARSLALDTNIAVEVTGLAARVAVTQVFRNDGFGWREAVYRFPLPPGAAVDRLRIEADDRVVEGEIREKSDARRRY